MCRVVQGEGTFGRARSHAAATHRQRTQVQSGHQRASGQGQMNTPVFITDRGNSVACAMVCTVFSGLQVAPEYKPHPPIFA